MGREQKEEREGGGGEEKFSLLIFGKIRHVFWIKICTHTRTQVRAKRTAAVIRMPCASELENEFSLVNYEVLILRIIITKLFKIAASLTFDNQSLSLFERCSYKNSWNKHSSVE